MQSCAAGRDGLRFQSRQTAVPGPTRGDITARRLGRAAEVAVGRGQVGFVALGAMGTAEWRSQEVRDTNAGNRGGRSLPRSPCSWSVCQGNCLCIP